MVSPSMDKAVDFPAEQCELIIVAKLPYPYLGTAVMKKRMKSDHSYVTSQTLLALRQMIGRGCRSATDVCPVHILDAATPKFLRQVKSKLPIEIKAALYVGMPGEVRSVAHQLSMPTISS